MSATASASNDTVNLSEKQHRILEYLRQHVDEQTYFKSRLIGDALDMSAKEVGTNMTALQESPVDVDVEKWGYSSSTTWMVTA
jgi:biotin operon repressor